MRRIANVLTLVAAVVGLHACAADAPTSPRPGTGGGGTALQIQLVTNDANPAAGTCTLIEAIVTLNGSPVPDGTGVNFSTDFGAFSQTGLPLVSVVTQGGAAVTSLCGPGAGPAKVRATATAAGNTGSATLTIIFQPAAGALPFVSSCSPSFGPKEGNTQLTLNGGRLSGAVSTTRVSFTVNGVTKDGIVQSVSANAIVVLTPGFTEFGAPQLLAQITVYLGSNVPPIVLSLPSCFSYGTVDSGTPTITSILPSSGTNEGNTRVTIVGSGFATSGVQVFFGTVEANVVSVSYNQIVVLSPPATGANENLNATVGVTVRNISSGLVSNAVDFTFTEPIIITAFSNNVQPLGGPFSPVTIFGRGFQAPVAVSLAGWGAFVQSVSSTELTVIPGPAIPSGCSDITGEISVTNITTGSSGSGGSFTYAVLKPVITGVSPSGGGGGASVTITGVNLPSSLADAEVKFGGQSALVTAASSTSLTVVAPTSGAAAPACTGGNPGGTLQTVATVDVSVTDRSTTCSIVASGAFQMQLPCVEPTPTPTP
jgi:IPT/TIG domain